MDKFWRKDLKLNEDDLYFKEYVFFDKDFH